MLGEAISTDCFTNDPIIGSDIDDSLVRCLRPYPYLYRGVIFGIRQKGRLLLADEIGRSIQALAIARYYKRNWPLLVVCPSSVECFWKQKIKRFVPAVNEIFILEKGSDQLPPIKIRNSVVILSYDLMVTKKEDLLKYKFRAIIFDASHLIKDLLHGDLPMQNHEAQRTSISTDLSDEPHLIKDIKAQRTSAATEISQGVLRLILLSGTPALSRPAELFSQIRIIDKSIFPNFHNFAVRYCDGKQTGFGFQANGCTNSDELSAVLRNTVMLRRLKKDVVHDLPAKLREVVFRSDTAVNENPDSLRRAEATSESEKGDAQNVKKNVVNKRQELFDHFHVVKKARIGKEVKKE